MGPAWLVAGYALFHHGVLDIHAFRALGGVTGGALQGGVGTALRLHFLAVLSMREAKIGRRRLRQGSPLDPILHFAIMAGGAAFCRGPHGVTLVDRADVAGLAGGEEFPVLEVVEIGLDPASHQAANSGTEKQESERERRPTGRSHGVAA
jgi:hypothetical protein